MARLIINSPDGKRGILELNKPVVTIGRGHANDLVLNDTSVSRFHAVIKMNEADAVTIADRGSTNGVLINGSRIATDTTLNDGDAIKVGVYGLKFECFNDSALIVKSAEIPSTLNHVLKGELQLSVRHEPVAPNTSQSDLLETVRKLERENYLLTVLYDAGKALNSKLSIDDIAAQVMELSFRIEGVERGFMMLFDKKGEVWRETEVKYRKPPAAGAVDQPRIIFSNTVLDRIKYEAQPILITDASEDERFSGSESLKISGLRSAMCAPLVGSQRLVGVLYVDNLQRKSAFTQEELNVFALVAAQAAIAIDNASTHEQLAESAIQRSALERFLSPDVVEMIAADPTGVKLGGINQKVSVMFADIRGFTSLSERMAPEKIVEVLNEYFTRVTDVIFDNGGTLDKYIGDAVMAVFGAPISKGNDAVNAVRVAVEIQRLLVEMNRDAAARSWPELQVGIGINTGIVTAGNIGSPRRIDYTVIGDPVNIASRLMSNAAPGQIIIAKSTADELGGKFALTGLAPLKVRGKAEPLDAFSVDWQKKAAGA
ncbi:MAG: Adenylate cyclase, family 3 (some protein containing domain) [Acidobacteriales bacterium]|nr:Adenylate cyclase, family 3 (some protein containing domain) [Terriglobales bacterium]